MIAAPCRQQAPHVPAHVCAPSPGCRSPACAAGWPAHRGRPRAPPATGGPRKWNSAQKLACSTNTCKPRPCGWHASSNLQIHRRQDHERTWCPWQTPIRKSPMDTTCTANGSMAAWWEQQCHERRGADRYRPCCNGAAAGTCLRVGPLGALIKVALRDCHVRAHGAQVVVGGLAGHKEQWLL